MGHLGMVVVRFSQLRRVARWHREGCKFGILRPSWRLRISRNRSSSIGLPLRLVDVSSDVASSRRKTSDWTLIPVKIFFRRGCTALAQLFHFLQSAKAAGRDDHPAADKISSARPEPSIAWKSIRCRCRICSSGSFSPTAEAARPPSISMQRCGAPISGGAHDEIGRRRSPLIQPGADPHHHHH